MREALQYLDRCDWLSQDERNETLKMVCEEPPKVGRPRQVVADRICYLIAT
jgi:hypothetical protein